MHAVLMGSLCSFLHFIKITNNTLSYIHTRRGSAQTVSGSLCLDPFQRVQPKGPANPRRSAMRLSRGSTVLALLLLGVASRHAHAQEYLTYGAPILSDESVINPVEKCNTNSDGHPASIYSDIDSSDDSDAPLSDPSGALDVTAADITEFSTAQSFTSGASDTDNSVMVESSVDAFYSVCKRCGMPDAAASAGDDMTMFQLSNELYATTQLSTILKSQPGEAKKACADMMLSGYVKPLESMAPGETQVAKTALPGSSCTIYRRDCNGVAGCKSGYDLKWSNGNNLQFDDADYYERSSGTRNAKVYVVRKSAKSKFVATVPTYKNTYTDLASACRANGASSFAGLAAHITAVLGPAPAGTLFVPNDVAYGAWKKPAKLDADDYHKEVIAHHYSPDTSCTTPRVPNEGHEMLSYQKWPLRMARTMSGHSVSCNSLNKARITANVVKPDILVGNLVVHIIDKVLEPPVPAPQPSPPANCKADIADVLIGQKDSLASKGYSVTKFAQLLKSYSRVVGNLYLNSPCTVFAPADEGLDQYLAHKGIKGISALTADQAVALIKQHIVPKSKLLKQHIFADQYLLTGRNRTVRCASASGDDVAVVSDTSISHVKVYDIQACKAVAHVVSYPLTAADYREDSKSHPKRPFPSNRPCLVNTIVKRADLSNGVHLLNAGGLDMHKLSSPELACTMLIPSASVNIKTVLANLPGGAANAHHVARQHIIAGVGRTVKNLTDEGVAYSIGDDREVSCDGSQVKSEGKSARFTKDVDNDVGNGLTKFHVIDDCLVPKIDTNSYKDAGDLVDNTPNLSFLKELLNITNMRSQLSGKSLSLYAPNNKAWKKLGQQMCGCEKGMSAQEMAAQPEIKEILSNHLSTTTDQLKVNGNGNGKGKKGFRFTQTFPGQGRGLTMRVAQNGRGKYQLIRGMGQSVTDVKRADVKCGQAVVQVVDTVIKPDSVIKKLNKSENYLCDAEIEYLNKFGAAAVSCGTAYAALYGKGPGTDAYVRLPCQGSKCFYAKVQLTTYGQTYSAVKVYTGALRLYGAGGNFQAVRYYAGSIGTKAGLDLYAGGLNAILALRWYGAGTIGTGSTAATRIYIPPLSVAPDANTEAVRYYTLSIGVRSSLWMTFTDPNSTGEGILAAVRLPIDNTGRR